MLFILLRLITWPPCDKGLLVPQAIYISAHVINATIIVIFSLCFVDEYVIFQYNCFVAGHELGYIRIGLTASRGTLEVEIIRAIGLFVPGDHLPGTVNVEITVLSNLLSQDILGTSLKSEIMSKCGR